ncbi:MAG: hypothetical protein IPK16_08325 [Anaerolineales bacterium]|nr:hypothetical protein [Anaerolineales bacterium]
MYFNLMHITTDNRAVFQGRLPGDTGTYNRLYSVQADGGSVTQLSTGLDGTQSVEDFEVSPDDKTAIFL